MRFVITVLITIAFILAIYFLTTRVILPIFGIDIISYQHSSNPVGPPAFQYGLEHNSFQHGTDADYSVPTLAGNFKGNFYKSNY